jgi:hypothetical protein
MAVCSVTVEDFVPSVPREEINDATELLPDAPGTLLAAAEEAFNRTLSRDPAAFVARSRQASGE